eukprot:COSAG02_NODE_4655_length_5128_cov_2.384569_2_plen_67_part_00
MRLPHMLMDTGSHNGNRFSSFSFTFSFHYPASPADFWARKGEMGTWHPIALPGFVRQAYVRTITFI